MNDANEASERDMFWLKALIADNVVFAGWIAVIAYVGHKSFGWSDFGITPSVLFAIAIGGAGLIWIGTVLVGRRVDKRIYAGLQECGFTDDAIEELKLHQKSG